MKEPLFPEHMWVISRFVSGISRKLWWYKDCRRVVTVKSKFNAEPTIWHWFWSISSLGSANESRPVMPIVENGCSAAGWWRTISAHCEKSRHILRTGHNVRNDYNSTTPLCLLEIDLLDPRSTVNDCRDHFRQQIQEKRHSIRSASEHWTAFGQRVEGVSLLASIAQFRRALRPGEGNSLQKVD